jgi:membrane protein required for colicin V production
LSAFFALMRGLVSEVLSVGGWVGAALTTLYAFPRLQPYMRGHVDPAWLADGMAIVGVFVLSLVIFSVIAHEISKMVRGSALSSVDRSLGLLFGVARGALLVCLAWMVAVWMMPDRDKDQPPWLREAKFVPLAETGAAYLQALVPAQMRSEAAAQADALRDTAKQKYDEAQLLHRMATAKPEAPQPAPATAGAAAPSGPPQVPPPPVIGAVPTGAPTPTAVPPNAAGEHGPAFYDKKEQGELDRLFKNAN